MKSHTTPDYSPLDLPAAARPSSCECMHHEIERLRAELAAALSSRSEAEEAAYFRGTEAGLDASRAEEYREELARAEENWRRQSQELSAANELNGIIGAENYRVAAELAAEKKRSEALGAAFTLADNRYLEMGEACRKLREELDALSSAAAEAIEDCKGCFHEVGFDSDGSNCPDCHGLRAALPDWKEHLSEPAPPSCDICHAQASVLITDSHGRTCVDCRSAMGTQTAPVEGRPEAENICTCSYDDSEEMTRHSAFCPADWNRPYRRVSAREPAAPEPRYCYDMHGSGLLQCTLQRGHHGPHQSFPGDETWSNKAYPPAPEPGPALSEEELQRLATQFHELIVGGEIDVEMPVDSAWMDCARAAERFFQARPAPSPPAEPRCEAVPDPSCPSLGRCELRAGHESHRAHGVRWADESEPADVDAAERRIVEECARIAMTYCDLRKGHTKAAASRDATAKAVAAAIRHRFATQGAAGQEKGTES